MTRFANKRTLHHLLPRTYKPISSNITRTSTINTSPLIHQPNRPTFRFQITSTHNRTMADDASYSSFLKQASQPLSAQHQTESTSQARSAHDPTEANSSAPASIAFLLSTNPTYTSETDSPFSPVFFSYAGADLPTAEQFKQCLSKSKSHSSASGEIEELSVKDWDPRGDYQAVIDAVSQAGQKGKSDVKVYSVQVSKTRTEYYILTIGADGRKLVGVVTKAVES